MQLFDTLGLFLKSMFKKPKGKTITTIHKILFFMTLCGFSPAVLSDESSYGNSVREGNSERGAGLVEVCAACHGVSGNSSISENPKLAGQNAGYLLKQMLDYQTGKRTNANMQSMLNNLEEQDLVDIAVYYADQEVEPNVARANEEKIALGKRIYMGGDFSKGITACTACHGPQGKGIPSAKFPSLSYQHADYTASQLKHFRQYFVNQEMDEEETVRANDYERMMRIVAKNLSNEEIEALAQYIAGLH